MNFYSKGIKRILDFVLAIIALIILSPILFLISMSILIEDGRPVIFKQKRAGKDAKEFVIYKFRSMPKGVKNIPSAQAINLPITKVGKAIRRLSFDELPQLINIIKGDMSVVGPRAPMPDQKYLIELRMKSGVFNLRPGLTGLAQINSYDGMPEKEKVEWDSKYLMKVSFVEDLKIILKTVSYLLKPPPVY